MVRKRKVTGVAVVLVAVVVLLGILGRSYWHIPGDSNVDEMEVSNDYLLAGTYSSNDYISFDDYNAYMIAVGAGGKSYSMNELRQMFANGRYWNHEGNPSSTDPNSVTDRPCHNTNYDTSCCNLFSYGAQCAGYAMYMEYLYHGSNLDPMYYGVSHNIDDLRVGDAVRINWYGGGYDHMIFVTSINGNTITYTDCNSDLHCRIAWDKTISKSELAQLMTYRLNQSWSYPNQASDTGFILSWDKRRTPEPPKVIKIDGDDEPTKVIDSGNTNVQYKITTCKAQYKKTVKYAGYVSTPDIKLYYANGKEVPNDYFYVDDEADFMVEPNTTYKINIKASSRGDLVGSMTVEYKYGVCDINSEFVSYYQEDDGAVHLSNLYNEKTLNKGVDYNVKVSNGIITVTGINNYSGTITDKVNNYSQSAVAPTTKPTQPATEAPTTNPTQPATEAPTQKPTQAPTEASTQKPTQPATKAPTTKPTESSISTQSTMSIDDKYKTTPVAISNNKGEIKITWNKAPGADNGYRIYVWDDKDVECYIDNLVYMKDVGTDTYSYTVTGIPSGEYKVVIASLYYNESAKCGFQYASFGNETNVLVK